MQKGGLWEVYSVYDYSTLACQDLTPMFHMLFAFEVVRMGFWDVSFGADFHSIWLVSVMWNNCL